MGWSVGRGVPSPLKKGSGEGDVPPPQKFFKIFLVQCVQKFLCSGPSPSGPPKYATGLTAKNRDWLRNPTLGNRVWATFLRDFYCRHPSLYTSLPQPILISQLRVDMRSASSTVNCYDVFVSIAPLFTLTLQQQQPVNRQCTLHWFCDNKHPASMFLYRLIDAARI